MNMYLQWRNFIISSTMQTVEVVIETFVEKKVLINIYEVKCDYNWFI